MMSRSRSIRSPSQEKIEQKRSLSRPRNNILTIRDLSEKMDKLTKDIEELKKTPVNVALIEEEEVQIQYVFFPEDKERENVMLLDLGAPYSIVGKTWIRKYIEENKMKIEDLKQRKCRKFRFGPGKVHNSEVI